jgi:hypothetical protein
LSQSGGLQTLSASLFNNTNDFFTHSLSISGLQELTADLYLNENTFFQHYIPVEEKNKYGAGFPERNRRIKEDDEMVMLSIIKCFIQMQK